MAIIAHYTTIWIFVISSYLHQFWAVEDFVGGVYESCGL